MAQQSDVLRWVVAAGPTRKPLAPEQLYFVVCARARERQKSDGQPDNYGCEAAKLQAEKRKLWGGEGVRSRGSKSFSPIQYDGVPRGPRTGRMCNPRHRRYSPLGGGA